VNLTLTLYIPIHHCSILLKIRTVFEQHTIHLNSQRQQQQWKISNRTCAGSAGTTTYHGPRLVKNASELHYQLDTKTARSSNGKSTLLAASGSRFREKESDFIPQIFGISQGASCNCDSRRRRFFARTLSRSRLRETVFL
jgi:hypothetical protein